MVRAGEEMFRSSVNSWQLRGMCSSWRNWMMRKPGVGHRPSRSETNALTMSSAQAGDWSLGWETGARRLSLRLLASWSIDHPQ